MALGIECRGRSQIARGNVAAGVADLDEAMCSVIADELSPLFTGWIYCHVLVACWDITDLRRAAEWTDAALRWCEVLPGTDAPFQGLCRIHRVEIATWRGDWAEADAEARRTCDELLSYEPNAAGMAFEAAGEVRRRMGDVVGAEAAFSRAHELGYEPQPGLALLELSRGQTAAAAAALELALTAKPTPGLPRAKLRAAQVDVALATDDLRTAADAVAELESFAERLQTPVARAIALHAVGTLELAEGSAGDSVLSLRRAVELWQEVGAPYEAALARERLATALAHAGDERGAKLEREVAHSVFRRLGAEEDVRRIERLPTPRDGARGALTSREVEVLRLVARGMTNREIAEELVISAHTVARHLNNIFAKLGVSTRTAATAYAFTHEIAQ
jgi:DNA-binding CsgD family transcriptional regulator